MIKSLRFCRLGAHLALILLSIPAHSHVMEHNDIDIVYSTEKSYYTEFSNSLYEQLADNPRFKVRMVTMKDYSKHGNHGDHTHSGLTINVGQKPALLFLQQNNPAPVLFTMITRAFYNEQIKHQDICNITRCSAIFIDQPLSRYLSLIDSMFPDAPRVGILASKDNQELDTMIKSVSELQGRNIKVHTIARDADLHELLPELLKETDILLSLPDTAIYNRNTIRTILLTTLRLNIPVIGYSRSYVKAGATAGLFTDTTQMARHASEIASLLTIEQPGSTISSHPKYYSLDINYWVAESLKLKIPKQEEIEKKVFDGKNPNH